MSDDADALTRAELMQRARDADVAGRSTMTKEQLTSAPAVTYAAR